MKKSNYLPITLLFVVFASTFSFGQHKAFSDVYKPGDELYVHANAGLSLRETADPKGKILTVVKHGEKIKVLPHGAQAAFANSGIPGVWVKVAYQNFEGYQFSGFLSRYMPGAGDQPDLFLKSIFKLKSSSEKHPDNRVYNQYEELYFDNNVIFVWSAPEGGSDIIITFPESAFTFQEVYLYAKSMYPEKFADNKCPYVEGNISCGDDNSSFTLKYTAPGDKFHPVPAIQLNAGFAD